MGFCCGMVGTVTVIGGTPTPTPSSLLLPHPRPHPHPHPHLLARHPRQPRPRSRSTSLPDWTWEPAIRLPIGGIIITPGEAKRVLLRAIGPSLSNFGITDPLADPVLELHGSDGSLITMDDNWKDSPTKRDRGDRASAFKRSSSLPSSRPSIPGSTPRSLAVRTGGPASAWSKRMTWIRAPRLSWATSAPAGLSTSATTS